MSDLRKAAEMALEALEMFCEHGAILRPLETKETLRQALAQPEHEPVAWVLHRELFWPSEYEVICEAGDNAIPLYTAPPSIEAAVLAEREACEEAIEEVARKYRRQHYADAENIADECAGAIRARGEK